MSIRRKAAAVLSVLTFGVIAAVGAVAPASAVTSPATSIPPKTVR